MWTAAFYLEGQQERHPHTPFLPTSIHPCPNTNTKRISQTCPPPTTPTPLYLTPSPAQTSNRGSTSCYIPPATKSQTPHRTPYTCTLFLNVTPKNRPNSNTLR
ncbi:hypothetical protein COCSADRAFT_272929 [Bipolaris sorokiniana ND90Pr]|uniref:Uncharacterized protein n=1 Tax=Cochliobolus sativus (strain ND90Pr / ATCC 201652) TaxID=665912 RepID=M2TGU9_COCSN|nr:uncharacterized protein COCSADRAFT_272929 [Bipolaris sorokiniana ND90Pr]EMD68456.1 hypothetical protein COCSADRAFT_272929 [Bipolaris sorokiniana ND90Pr]